jgi:hypothetical protein
VPGMLNTLHIGLVGATSFSPKVAKQIKYIIIRVNSAARYIIPLMSEFEILSSTKNADRISELETEIILKIFDRFMSITAILSIAQI